MTREISEISVKTAKRSEMGKSVLQLYSLGETIIQLAETYPTLLDVLFEKVQNALDEGATRIWIVDNKKSRHLTVRDNGEGASRERFESALAHVGRTMKAEGKLGRFGRGLISSLNKCQRCIFTSSPKNEPRGYLEWTFIPEDIKVQCDKVVIPMRSRPDFVYGVAKGKHGELVVDWRTEVRIEEYTEDRVIGRVTMESLAEGILERFNSSMHRLGTIVSIRLRDARGGEEYREVRAKEYHGAVLEEVVINDPDGGDVLFRLFLAPKTAKGRHGKVLVGEADNEFRIAFAKFASSASEWLRPDAGQALSSGIFEGEILSSKVKLNVRRKSFETDASLVGFVAAIEKWYATVGRQHFNEAQSSRKEERWQELGIRSMKAIESLLTNQGFEYLREVVTKFRAGNIGKEHTPPDEESVEGVEERPQKSIDGVTSKRTRKANAKKRDKEGEHPRHIPFTVIGPQGQRRRTVRSNSLGLALSYEDIPNSEKLWELDMDKGILQLNICHPYFVECDKAADSVFMRFQEYLVVQALTLHAMPEEWQEHQRLVLDEIMPAYVYMLVNGDKLAGRLPGGKRQERAKAALKDALGPVEESPCA